MVTSRLMNERKHQVWPQRYLIQLSWNSFGSLGPHKVEVYFSAMYKFQPKSVFQSFQLLSTTVYCPPTECPAEGRAPFVGFVSIIKHRDQQLWTAHVALGYWLMFDLVKSTTLTNNLLRKSYDDDCDLCSCEVPAESCFNSSQKLLGILWLESRNWELRSHDNDASHHHL